MKSVLISLMIMAGFISANAQTAAEVAQSINTIKRDTMYIYAEATMKDLDEACNGARAILEMKVSDWVLKQHPDEGIEVCIVKAKEHFVQLETRRGDFYRAFVYVRKNDILPVSDKSEVEVFEVVPIDNAKDEKAISATAIQEDDVVKEENTSVLELTAEEKQMKQVKTFYDIEPYIKGLKSKGKLKKYGKYATMPADEDCHLFVYDKQGNITALIRKSATSQYNLNTLKEDNINDYKNCGAIWLQLND